MPTHSTPNDSVTAESELSRVQPFCADQLPEWLRNYTGELAIRYSVPQADLTLACLATAGTVVGSRAKAELGWGAQATASNLLVVMKPGASANLEEAVQHIIAPVLARQLEMLKRQGEFNDFKLENKIRPQKMRNAYLREGVLRNYLAEAGNLLRTAKPVLLVGRLNRGTLIRALKQSADGTLFMCNESAAQEGPSSTEDNPPMDMDLVERCLNRLPVRESLGRRKVEIAEPSLGGVLITTPPGFASWFDQFRLSPVLGSSLLLLRSPGKAAPINNAALEAVTFQEEWGARIEGLMKGWNPEGFPLRLSRQGLATLFEFRNQLQHLASSLIPPAHSMCTAPYQLAGRLMIGLHLLVDSGSPQIPDETVAAAVMLAKHYGPRQICTSRDANAAWMKDHSFHPELAHLDAA